MPHRVPHHHPFRARTDRVCERSLNGRQVAERAPASCRIHERLLSGRRLLRAILAVGAVGVVVGTATSVHAQQKDAPPAAAASEHASAPAAAEANTAAVSPPAEPPTAGEDTAEGNAPPKNLTPSDAVDDTPQPDALLDPEAPTPGVSSGIGEMIGPFIKSMLMLAVVVGLAYLTLHKGLGKLMMRAQVGKRMKVVERVSLDQRRSLYLVEIDGNEVVLAGGEGGVVHIASLNGDDMTAASSATAPPPPSRSFKDILQTPRADAARDEQAS